MENALDKPSVILGAVIGSAIGAIFYNVLPLYLGMAQEYRGLDNIQIGIVGFAFFLGYNAATLTAFFWVRRFSWRFISRIAAPVGAVGLASAAWVDSYIFLLMSVCVSGAALAGIFGLCATVLSDTSNPAKWYGAKTASETLLGALLFLTLPAMVIERFGFNGLVLALAGVVLILSPLLWLIPAQGLEAKTHDGDASNWPKTNTLTSAIYLMLCATLLWFCGQTVMWSFVERIGAAAGHSNEDVGMVLAITLISATLGSLAAATLSDRYGTLKPFQLSSFLFLIAVPLFLDSAVFSFYLCGACLVMFSVGYGIPYVFSIVAKLDNDGRFTVLVVPAIGIGAMIAPGLAGWLSASGDFQPLLIAASCFVIVSMGLAFASAKLASPK